jgi:hypothetical protein
MFAFPVNFALYQRAIATMIERLAKTAPNETCYPTMTVLAVEMAVWFTESLALRPLEPVMQFVKQSLSRDNTYPLFSSLFDNVIDTYGHFRDPIHLAITGALLKAVNNLVTPTPMNATDIDDALRAQHKLTTATIAAIFKEFPCSDTKPQCLFDAQRIRKLGAKAEMLIKSRKIQKASVTDLPSSDPIIEPGTHKRRATGAPSVNHRPVANVQNMVQPEKAKKASTTDIPSPKPIVAPGAKKPKTTGAPSATHRPALNQSLVKSNQEMADGSVKKARSTHHSTICALELSSLTSHSRSVEAETSDRSRGPLSAMSLFTSISFIHVLGCSLYLKMNQRCTVRVFLFDRLCGRIMNMIIIKWCTRVVVAVPRPQQIPGQSVLIVMLLLPFMMLLLPRNQVLLLFLHPLLNLHLFALIQR